MEYRILGKTGLSISAIGFGCGSTGGLFVRGTPEDQRAALKRAISGGVNYVDTAAQYGEGRSELNLGRTLRDLDVSPYIGTKLRIQPDEISKADDLLLQRLNESLARLGRDQVDVCTLHTKVGTGANELPASAVLDAIVPAMRSLVTKGLATAIGFTGLGETDELHIVASSGCFDVFQCYYNLLNQSADRPGSPDGASQDFRGLLNVAYNQGTAAVGIRVLAGGSLVGDNSRHRVAGPVGAAMAKGEDYGDNVGRAVPYRKYLSECDAGSLPELAYRFALSNEKLTTILGGFSDVAQVDRALEYEAKGPLLDASLLQTPASLP